MFRGYPNCSVHHVGGVLMYRIGRDGFTFPPVPAPGDACVFVFGEIDVRCHIARIAERDKRNIVQVMIELATDYLTSIQRFAMAYEITPVVCCILPASDRGHENSLPVYGPLWQRSLVTIGMNELLRRGCDSAGGIKFLDYWGEFAMSDGSLRHDRSDGLLHVAEKFYPIVHAALNQLLSRDP
jgi:hypothetical protein